MRIFRSLVLLLAVVLVTPFYALQFAQAEEVVFADPVLEQAVRQQLGITGSLSQTDLDQLSILDLKEGTVNSLNGLEHAHNLSVVTINNANVSDLTPLASLTELVYLSMNNNRIQDIRPLSGLRKLLYLDLSGNQISDVSSLSSITSIDELILANNPIDLKNTDNRNALLSLKQKGVAIDIPIEETAPEQSQSQPATAEPQLKWTKLYPERTDLANHKDLYAYGNGIYVSSDGSTSKDGVTWSKNPKLANFKMRAIVWGKGRFVALEFKLYNKSSLWTSADGLNWTEYDQKIDNLYSIAFNGSRFVAVGGDSRTGLVMTSEDGLHWTKRNTDMKSGLGDVSWGNGTFVAFNEGAFAVSKDGIAWKKVASPAKDKPFRDLHFGGSAFVAVGDFALFTSKDGVKWSSVPSDGIYWSRIIWVKDRFFIEGSKYSKDKIETIAVFKTSKDGKTWSDVVGLGPLTSKQYGTFGTFYHLNTLHDGKQYVTYTDIGIFTSVDGVQWKLTKKATIKPFYLTNSAVGNGKLVAVGGTVDDYYPKAEKVADRGVWSIDSKGAYRSNLEFGKFPLYDVIWTGNQFFAIGAEGLMMTSKDGIKWSKAASPTKETLSRIIQANGTYYVTGSNGLIMTSKDLKTWKKQKTNTEAFISSIAWNGKKFVAVGDWGVTLVSDNGTVWKAGSKIKSANGDAIYNLSDVVWGNGVFIMTAAQRYHVDREYTVFKSADGTTWKKQSLAYSSPAGVSTLSPSLYSIRYFGDTFVTVGNNGSVYLSKDGDQWSREAIPDSVILFSAQLFNGKLYVTGYTHQIYIAEFKAQ
ncbi:hypothetical protein ACFPPD_12340 [Cohnella suwonensis]|uniref:Photosynthesis system II assembly factor Ycf48/Hcf136-like domain-containing protein n=1 Tax=Cohnella suwonensis TaxID=696072 RepID=A0ABW0LUH4_9BACL